MGEGRSYSPAIDIFAVGVILFSMLGGYEPFFPPNNFSPVEFDPNYWDHISEECQEFIRGLLELNPQERLTAEMALAHRWFTTELSHDVAVSSSFGAPPNYSLL